MAVPRTVGTSRAGKGGSYQVRPSKRLRARRTGPSYGADFARITAHHCDSVGTRKITRIVVVRRSLALVQYRLRDDTGHSRAISEEA